MVERYTDSVWCTCCQTWYLNKDLPVNKAKRIMCPECHKPLRLRSRNISRKQKTAPKPKPTPEIIPYIHDKAFFSTPTIAKALLSGEWA